MLRPMDRNDILRSIENHKSGLAPLLSEYEDLTKATKGKGEGGKDRPFTAEEWEKHKNLGVSINQLNQAIGTDRAMLKALNLSEASDDQTADDLGYSDRSKLPHATDEYMEAFLAFGRGGFTGQGLDPERFKNLTTVAPSTGGVLIPTVLETEILMEAAAQCPLLRISQVEMTSILKDQIPFMGDLGVMGPRKEAEAYVMSEPALTVKQVDIFNYGGFFGVSQELMEDAPQLQAAFKEAWGRSYALTVEEYGWKGTAGQTAFTNQAGSGVTITLAGRVCPGIRSFDNTVIPIVVAGSVAGASTDDLIKLRQAIDPEVRSGSTYVLSADYETKALLLKDTTGRPIWQPNIIVGQPSTLNGLPYEVSSRLDAAAASANSAFCGNFKRGHKIVIRKGLIVKTSGHYLFGNGMIAVAGDARWGATVKYKNYIARLNHPAS
jgi:HK97 family phage major capsid protein